jgi:hypothetical protein
MNVKNINLLLIAMSAATLFVGCSDNEPQKEDVPELITNVTLTFSPVSGNVVVVRANDPDGEGVQNLVVDSPINLEANKTYTLSISLVNGLAEPASPDYNVTEEVEEQGDEHMFFFAWTNNLFSNPVGNGNISDRQNPVNYSGASNSVDRNNMPLGLSTSWTTANSGATGTFRVLLKHQPGLKSTTSTSNDGETDVDVTFDFKIK